MCNEKKGKKASEFFSALTGPEEDIGNREKGAENGLRKE
jgi:hypothetical protein